jgi:phosphoribosyl 1,2-cyclic phosphodiesterase
MPQLDPKLAIGIAMLLSFSFWTTVDAQANVIGNANFATWFNVTSFPDAQASNVSQYMAEAQRVSWPDLFQHFLIRCIDAQKYPTILGGIHPYGFIEPARPFDSLFFVGQAEVSSWAIDTGAGLVIIDTLDNPDEVKRVLLPGLAAFNYTGHDIAAVIVTHEHADHYGGAAYLQDTFGSPVWASEIAWDTMNKTKGAPKKDKILTDGQVLKVGNTSITAVATPGHTPGCYSFIFPVYEQAVKHMVGFFGGGGIPSAADAKTTQVQSFTKFANAADRANVDVLLSNHQDQDQAVQNFDILTNRAKSLPNPFVIGKEAYLRYLKVMQICVRVSAARAGQMLTV